MNATYKYLLVLVALFAAVDQSEAGRDSRRRRRRWIPPPPPLCSIGGWRDDGACKYPAGRTCGGLCVQPRIRDVTPHHCFMRFIHPTRMNIMKAGTPCPVNCQFAPWGGWGGCSKACGGGTQTRHRGIAVQAQHGGAQCAAAAATESRGCNESPCPVDCVMGSWGEWGTCDASCGGGVQQRTRPVAQDAAHGGASCGEEAESQACNEMPCPVDCKISDEFTDWSPCTGECGSGTQTRAKTILVESAAGGAPCPEASTLEESQQCLGEWQDDCLEDFHCGPQGHAVLGYNGQSQGLDPPEERVSRLECAKRCYNDAKCVSFDFGDFGTDESANGVCGLNSVRPTYTAGGTASELPTYVVCSAKFDRDPDPTATPGKVDTPAAEQHTVVAKTTEEINKLAEEAEAAATANSEVEEKNNQAEDEQAAARDDEEVAKHPEVLTKISQEDFKTCEGSQKCDADGSYFCCSNPACNQRRKCDSNAGLEYCACPPAEETAEEDAEEAAASDGGAAKASRSARLFAQF